MTVLNFPDGGRIKVLSPGVIDLHLADGQVVRLEGGPAALVARLIDSYIRLGEERDSTARARVELRA